MIISKHPLLSLQKTLFLVGSEILDILNFDLILFDIVFFLFWHCYLQDKSYVIISEQSLLCILKILLLVVVVVGEKSWIYEMLILSANYFIPFLPPTHFLRLIFFHTNIFFIFLHIFYLYKPMSNTIKNYNNTHFSC